MIRLSRRGETGKSCERGQVLVIGLFVVIGLSLVAISVANIGMVVAEKIHLQDAVDAAAYSAAVVEARFMNLSAYINRAMVANYNSMAFNTAIWAVADSLDHGLAVVAFILYLLSIVFTIIGYGSTVDSAADVVHSVHEAIHQWNYYMNEYFAQDGDDWNQYIEMFNIHVLTMYEGMLYAALQSSRFDVVQEVAKEMDPEIVTTTVLGLGAEASSYDELAKAVDWAITETDSRDEPFNSFNDSFNRMFGEDAKTHDHPLMLGAVTEASLDKFAAGRDRDDIQDLLRNPGFNDNMIPGANVMETIIEIACEIITLSLGSCNSNIDLNIGGSVRDGYEDYASQSHVPFIARQRMREVNLFGLDFSINVNISDEIEFDLADVGGFTGSQGHTSGEKNADVANYANLIDLLSSDWSFSRAFQCVLTGCNLNKMNVTASEMGGVIPPIVVDDHWDGSFDDLTADRMYELYGAGPGQVDAIEYAVKVYTDGEEEGVPKYDWQVDLDDVGIAHYHYPTGVGQERLSGNSRSTDDDFMSGPSIGVVGIKRSDDTNSIRGFGSDAYPDGIGNGYTLSATARSQVYYLKSPNRPEETASMFNPHWVPRLAPLDESDVPILLSEGLPYIASAGNVIRPTH